MEFGNVGKQINTS